MRSGSNSLSDRRSRGGIVKRYPAAPATRAAAMVAIQTLLVIIVAILPFVVLRDLPFRARLYIVSVIAVGSVTFVLMLPKAQPAPVLPLLFFAALSSLTSALKVQFPIASGSNMSVSYVVDIAALIIRGPHTT